MKKNRRRRQRFTGRILTIVGLICISIWLGHATLYNRSLRLSNALFQSFSYTYTRAAQPIRIVLGKNIQLPIIEAGMVNGHWIVSDDKANHVWNSANPTESGNIIIYAHNKPKLFGQLSQVTVGDYAHLVTSDGVDHLYQIIYKEVVSPTNTIPLQPTTAETLTIYTCAGFLDSQRLVIRAMPAREIDQ